MILAYISVPYTIKSHETIREASNKVLEVAGNLNQKDSRVLGVNGMLSWYQQMVPTQDKEIYPFCRSLIDSCDVLAVVRSPGWEYSDIVMNEAAYAASLKKQVIYIDP